MWKLAFATVGVATGVVCHIVYCAKIRDSKWLEQVARKLQRNKATTIVIEK